MTDDEMLTLVLNGCIPVHVKANDYEYDGWLVSAFAKRRGGWRCVVEDINGRLFIHNAAQLSEEEK